MIIRVFIYLFFLSVLGLRRLRNYRPILCELTQHCLLINTLLRTDSKLCISLAIQYISSFVVGGEWRVCVCADQSGTVRICCHADRTCCPCSILLTFRKGEARRSSASHVHTPNLHQWRSEFCCDVTYWLKQRVHVYTGFVVHRGHCVVWSGAIGRKCEGVTYALLCITLTMYIIMSLVAVISHNKYDNNMLSRSQFYGLKYLGHVTTYSFSCKVYTTRKGERLGQN